jgi:hypothetical protein
LFLMLAIFECAHRQAFMEIHASSSWCSSAGRNDISYDSC